MKRSARSEQITKLLEEIGRLKKITQTDDLTGLLNRRGLREFIESLGSEIPRIAIIYFDLDNFKKLQDKPGNGHEWGDLALRTFAYVLRHSLRHTDVAVRDGGDEFCVILPGVANENIKAFLGRLWENLDNNLAGTERLKTTYGISVGPVEKFAEKYSEAKKKMEKEKQARHRGR